MNCGCTCHYNTNYSGFKTYIDPPVNTDYSTNYYKNEIELKKHMIKDLQAKVDSLTREKAELCFKLEDLMSNQRRVKEMKQFEIMELEQSLCRKKFEEREQELVDIIEELKRKNREINNKYTKLKESDTRCSQYSQYHSGNNNYFKNHTQTQTESIDVITNSNVLLEKRKKRIDDLNNHSLYKTKISNTKGSTMSNSDEINRKIDRLYKENEKMKVQINNLLKNNNIRSNSNEASKEVDHQIEFLTQKLKQQKRQISIKENKSSGINNNSRDKTATHSTSKSLNKSYCYTPSTMNYHIRTKCHKHC